MVPKLDTSQHTTQSKKRTQMSLLLASAICIGIPIAIGYDGPPDGDPSAWTDLVYGTDPHVGPEHMNHHAFEGGPTGTKADVVVNNVLPNADEGNGKFKIPTGGLPSPLYGAGKFEVQMLRFEEFGSREMPASYDNPRAPFPPPFDSTSCPDGPGVDEFLKGDI